ncbi:ribosome hibernation-promoting factor, HPF/YfiA family [Thalassotalea sp. PS06]|uniref:ribosome hibernation-promoting factor, HPF/YfiA family n=1 Tax=Thalassotalea sp. PS06 TaxID=2594005 RepID=UPI001162F074|nr:ribosome-associated translation inhibitor RaiA [Thalassotalea sp. PS06]QDP01587.1 ribosome-associated translation inhibitor RaiA [Thalassotalea sp. PS06]
MKINISGHHVEVTEAIADVIHSKYAKVGNHFPSLMSLDIILKVEKNIQKIEVTTLYENVKVSITAVADDMYKAIGNSVKKLESALAHRKGVINANLHDKFEVQEQELVAQTH